MASESSEDAEFTGGGGGDGGGRRGGRGGTWPAAFFISGWYDERQAAAAAARATRATAALAARARGARDDGSGPSHPAAPALHVEAWLLILNHAESCRCAGLFPSPHFLTRGAAITGVRPSLNYRHVLIGLFLVTAQCSSCPGAV